jgi:hypothetical protein
MNNKDLNVKTLHKVVDYLIDENCEDVCQKCIYLREYTEEEMSLLEEGVDCCFHRRTNGKVACRNGIIEYFQREVNNVKD